MNIFKIYFKLFVIAWIYGFSLLSNNLHCQERDSLALIKQLANLYTSADSIDAMIQFSEGTISSNPKLAQHYITKANSIALRSNDPKEMNKVGLVQGIFHRNRGEHTKALEILTPIMASYKDIDAKPEIAKTAKTIADILMREKRFDESSVHFELCKSIYKELRDSSGIGQTYRGLSSLARRKGDYPTSLETGLKAMHFLKAANDQNGIALMHNSLGLIYTSINEYEDAKFHFEESLDLAIKQDQKTRQASAYTNLAYISRANESEKLKYYKKNLAINLELNRPRYIARVYYDIGISQKNLNRYEDALNSYKESERYFNIANLPPINRLPLAIGELYVLLGQDIRAKPYLEQGLIQAESQGDNDDKSSAYSLLSKVYSHFGDYKKAYELKTLHKNLNDSLISVDKNRQLAEMETTYKVKEKDFEIQRLEVVESLQKKTILLIAGILALLSILALTLWRNSINQKKSNRLLKKQKLEIETRNEQNETLLKEIHHRVKNNLQVISALLTLQSKYVEDKNAIEALQKGQDRVESMALIHKDLYQHNNLKGVNIADYFEKLVENLLESYQVEEGDITLDLDVDPIWLDVDTMIPLGLLVNELISNALKHAFKNKDSGEIKVSLKESNNSLILIVSDNGSGISNFDSFQDKSFGYSLIQSFAKRLDADLNFENSAGLSVSMVIKSYEKSDPIAA